MAAPEPINPKASWITDQQLNPWDEPKHFVLNGDLTKGTPYKKGSKPQAAKAAKAAPSTAGADKK